VAVLPIGSVEQHAAHLPVGTDSLLVQAVANGVEAARPERVVLLPPVWFGASSHHVAFPGTGSVASGDLIDYLFDAIASLHRSSGLRSFFVLNGHGGNEPAMRIVLERVRDGLPGVRAYAASYWYALFDAMRDAGNPYAEGMGHACHVETSLLLAIRPDLVDLPAAQPGRRVGHPEEWLHQSGGFDVMTERGGIGDPTHADAEQGALMLKLAVERLAALVDRLAPA
jgi:creatinine amidohydrolase